MPMFILISGFFQKEVVNFFEFSKRIKKTIVHIGLPLIVWALIATLVLYLLNAFGIYELQGERINRFFFTLYKSIRFYWFLPCLVLCIALNATISYCSNRFKIKLLPLYIVSLLVLLLIPKDMFHFQFMWPFFLLGICFRRYAQKGFISSLLRGETSTSQNVVLLTILGGGIFCCLYWPTKYTFYNIINCIFIKEFSIGDAILFIVLRQVLYIVVTLITMFLIIKLYFNIKNTWFARFITKIGQETLFIYLFHLIVVAYLFGAFVKLLTNGAGMFPDAPFLRYYILDTLLTLFIIIVSHYLNKNIELSKTLSKLLLGK